MDVQCERCKTEYEFDDALVSGRGTTVRCTNCGHQFKVRRSQGDQDNDRWMVRTTEGRELTFLTLRELQRAILAKQVARGDLLVRGRGPGRPLGSIAELEPFFDGRTSSRPPPPAGNTSPGGSYREAPTAPLTFPKRSASWEERPAPPPPLPPRNPTHIGVAPPAPPPRHKMDTLRPPSPAGAAPPPPPPIHPQRVIPATPAVAFEPEPPSEDPTTLRPAPMPAPVAPAAAFDPGPRRRALPSGDDEIPTRARASLPSAGEEAFGVPRPRRVGGWVVAFVLLLAVGVVGWAVAKPYLVARSSAAASRVDPRAQAFAGAGEKALVDGDLDLAQEDFDKASALAERDPRVLLDEAHVAAVKADVPWLKLKCLPPEATEEIRATKAQLDDRVARARRTADDAIAASPEDAAAIRTKIDALRLGGTQEAARAFVAKLIAQASQPETAYVLAALDLAEPEPLWTTVIERLRLAAAGEGNAGRARAALVYALAKSGDAAGAKAELGKLDGLLRPYPLLPNLHALVDKAASKPVGDAGAPAPAVVVARAEAPVAPPGAGAAANGLAGAGETAPAESKGGMAAAAAALRKGDFEKARQIYEGIVARSPSDSEALAGLGDVARLQGDSASAIAAYKRAIGVNPSYLPALLGMADTQWAGGSRAAAAKAYADIVDRFPDGTYPSYVKGRSEAAAPSPAQPKAAEAPTKSSPATAATDEL